MLGKFSTKVFNDKMFKIITANLITVNCYENN